MDARIANCAELFSLSNALLPKCMAGLSQAEVLRPAGPQSTPMLWMAAHLAHARCGLLNMLGVDAQIPWEGRFGRGSIVSDPSQYPAAADVLSRWKEIADQLQQRFETISSEELAARSPRDFPSRTSPSAGRFTSWLSMRPIMSARWPICGSGWEKRVWSANAAP